ncbi:MAG: hypothetical protein RLZZ225_643 [Pseudomonadota bacterium]|jgi:hypothetical protein
MPPLTLERICFDKIAYTLLASLAQRENLPAKTADLMAEINTETLRTLLGNLSLALKKRVDALLSLYPNSFSFLCAYGQLQQAITVEVLLPRQVATLLETLKLQTDDQMSNLEAFSFEDLDYKLAYCLARARRHDKVSCYIKEKKPHQLGLFSSKTRNYVFGKVATLGDLENLYQLLALEIDADERDSMKLKGIAGACEGGQLHVIQRLLSIDKDSQNYLVNKLATDFRFFRKACASGHLETLDFILSMIPKEKHKTAISDCYIANIHPYAAISEACSSGNLHILARTLEPFSTTEINAIFCPTETVGHFGTHFPYAQVLSHDSMAINQHIFARLSADSQEKIISSKVYAQAIILAYKKSDLERVNYFLKKIPREKLALLKNNLQAVMKDYSQLSYPGILARNLKRTAQTGDSKEDMDCNSTDSDSAPNPQKQTRFSR